MGRMYIARLMQILIDGDEDLFNLCLSQHYLSHIEMI